MVQSARLCPPYDIRIKQDVDGRDKPGHDEKTESQALTSGSADVISPSPGPSGLSAFGGTVTGTTRSSGGLDPRRRRLLFRAWHRGTREMDLIMGRFADATIGDLSEAELDEFERLAEAPEPDLYAWITGERPVPPDHDTALFRKLRDFATQGPNATKSTT
jgi:antitoxin CptB